MPRHSSVSVSCLAAGYRLTIQSRDYISLNDLGIPTACTPGPAWDVASQAELAKQQGYMAELPNGNNVIQYSVFCIRLILGSLSATHKMLYA